MGLANHFFVIWLFLWFSGFSQMITLEPVHQPGWKNMNPLKINMAPNRQQAARIHVSRAYIFDIPQRV